MEITTTKENLVKKLAEYFHLDLLNNLNEADLDQDEKDANIVLARKRIATDAENVANVVFKAFE